MLGKGAGSEQVREVRVAAHSCPWWLVLAATQKSIALDHCLTGSSEGSFRSQTGFVPGSGCLSQTLPVCLPHPPSPGTLSGHLASVCDPDPLPRSDLAFVFS